MSFPRRLFACLSRIWTRSIRRQLAWSFSVVALVVILATGYLLFSFQRDFLYAQGVRSALDMARTLSFSSASWVLANDVVGLQEVLKGSSEIADLKFALVLSPEGEILAATRPEYIGQFFDDAVSLRLLTLPAEPQILLDNVHLIDVAVPIKVGGHLIGWVRVELTRNTANVQLHKIAAEVLGIATFLALMMTAIAIKLARSLTLGLNRLAKVANDAERGQAFQRQDLTRRDEIGVLARHLYRMLDTIEVEKQATLESEARFRKLLQILPIPMAYSSKEGKIEYINDRFEQVFGYRHQDILTIEAWFSRAYPDPAYRAWVVEVWNAAINAAVELGRDIQPLEYNVTCKNGEVRIMEISGVTLGDNLLVTFIDLTARKQTEAQLTQYHDHLEQLVAERTEQLFKAKEAAEAANIAKSTFIATMSHELRTPLNAILGFSELMGRDEAATASQKETLGIINRSGSHLLSMINDVLDISKIEAGRLELNVHCFDLLKLLRDIGDMIKVRAAAKQLSFRLEIGSDTPQYIKADSGKLRQVLINLLGNAIKFTQQGGVILRANPETSTIPAISLLRIEVVDSGAGISSPQQAELFKPFVQLARSNSDIEGTGLGLAISKSLVELMGGNICVNSVLGVGSTFRIELPVPVVSADELETIAESQPVQGLAPGQPAWRILIVDDIFDNRRLLVSILTEVGFQVREAENGLEAIKVFEQWQPHVILMDMRMPVMDGYAATAKIRQLNGGTAVKIISVTASAFKEQHDSIIKVGCDAVLHKPVQSAEIFTALSQILGVSFIYQHKAVPVPDSTPLLTTEIVNRLPQELRRQLHAAAQNLDIEETENVIAQIWAIAADVAEALQKLAQNYQFEQIIQLTDVQNES